MATYNKFRYVKAHVKKNGSEVSAYFTKPKIFGYVKELTPQAVVSPNIKDLEWTAGFAEGEGTFFGHWDKGNCQVSFVQKNKEPLEKLQRILGGTITKRPHEIFALQTYGARARGIAMTLYPMLSEKRKEQIQNMLRR